MFKKILWSFVCALAFIGLTGCAPSNTSPQPETNPAPEFELNLGPNHELRESQYIDMKRMYMQAVGEAVNGYHTDNADASMRTLLGFYAYQSKTLLSYSEEEWSSEYLKTYIIRSQFYEIYKDTEEQYISIADSRVQEVKDTGKMTLIDSDSVLNIKELLENLAEKYDVSYEESIEEIFRPFFTSEIEDQYLMFYYSGEMYKGEKVELSETTSDEYLEYYIDLYNDYENYLNNILEKAQC